MKLANSSTRRKRGARGFSPWGKTGVEAARGRLFARRGGRRTSVTYSAAVTASPCTGEREIGAGRQQGGRLRVRLSFIEVGRGETLPRWRETWARSGGCGLDRRCGSGRWGKALTCGPRRQQLKKEEGARQRPPGRAGPAQEGKRGGRAAAGKEKGQSGRK